MHRTQIDLEDADYEALLARAGREGKSLAGLIRELLALAPGDSSRSGKRDPFDGVIGLGGGDGSAVADNYQDHLYGERR